VFEDAAAGFAAATAAGSDVLAITATHGAASTVAAGYPSVVDYRGLGVDIAPDGLRLATHI